MRYADRARKIKNKPIVNQDGKDAEIAKLKREVADMKLQLLNSGKLTSVISAFFEIKYEFFNRILQKVMTNKFPQFVTKIGTFPAPLLIFCLIFSGSSDHSSINKELEYVKSKNSQLTSENRELTAGLMNCQDELSHMNEKLLLTDDFATKLKTKLEELGAFVESLINKTPMKMDIENIFKKINNLMSMQKDAEKSMIEHDRSRFNVSNKIKTRNTTFKSPISSVKWIFLHEFGKSRLFLPTSK